MDFKVSLGLFIGFIITGVTVIIEAPRWAGIVILVFALIWGFLFVYPKSPVRRHWWYAPNLGIMLADDTDKIIISGDTSNIRVGMVAVQAIRVDRIILKINKKSCESDWESKEVKGNHPEYLVFTGLQQLAIGIYSARLYAYTTHGFSRSGKFTVETI